MQDDDTEQPLTDHLVDQFASYFLLTMLTFHLFGYVKKQYEKRMAEEKFPLRLASAGTTVVTFRGGGLIKQKNSNTSKKQNTNKSWANDPMNK